MFPKYSKYILNTFIYETCLLWTCTAQLQAGKGPTVDEVVADQTGALVGTATHEELKTMMTTATVVQQVLIYL